MSKRRRRCLFCGTLVHNVVHDVQENIWMCMPCADDEVWSLQQRFPSFMEDRFEVYGSDASGNQPAN